MRKESISITSRQEFYELCDKYKFILKIHSTFSNRYKKFCCTLLEHSSYHSRYIRFDSRPGYFGEDSYVRATEYSDLGHPYIATNEDKDSNYLIAYGNDPEEALDAVIEKLNSVGLIWP